MQPTRLEDAIRNTGYRHIVPLSGGKDSTALAVYMIENHGDLPLEFIFTDTGAELPETYDYIKRFEIIFDIEVQRLTALDLPELKVGSKDGRRSPFDIMLDEVYNGFLPSPAARWCTRMLKIKPFEMFVGDSECYTYIGIRDDENREGFGGAAKQHQGAYEAKRVSKPVALSARKNIHTVFPFKDIGYGIEDVRDVLNGSGLGLPDYYEWRSRSGCYFCFFQQKGEWQALNRHHPDLFKQSKTYEKTGPDGRKFTWNPQYTLDELEQSKKTYDIPVGEPEDGCAICHL